MTTQDTGLVEAAARALHMTNVSRMVVQPAWDQVTELQKLAYQRGVLTVVQVILPHLSPESQDMLRKELGDE